MPSTETATLAGFEHQVTDEALATRYQALCGQVFVAAPLVAPPS